MSTPSAPSSGTPLTGDAVRRVDTIGPRQPERWLAMAAGVAAVAAGVGAGEIVAAVLVREASPFAVVGSWIIDLSPSWLKDAVIALFGTADKLVLLSCVALLVLALAALSGVLERRRPPSGRILLAVVGALGIVAALTRANATALWAIPAATAMILSVALLRVLLRRAFPATTRVVDTTPPAEADAAEAATATDGATDRHGRRSFLILAGATTAVGVLAAIGGRIVDATVQSVDSARRLFTLPVPAVAAPPVPTGAELDIPGLASLVTPNQDFYRIDTALLVPAVDPATWSLRIYGLVDNEITITFDELLALDLEESYTTLACVSNYVGGGLIGNALWLGYPIRKLLERAGPQSGADMVLSRSIDGFTAGTPLGALTDDRNAILAVGMNGEPLPAQHGFPVRMVVPGLYGYVSATKWVTELKVTRFADDAGYWTPLGWSALGPVKLSSRVDTPRNGASLAAGPAVIAGVAWSQHVGISRVEVQVDDGAWEEATLAADLTADSWRQWFLPWTASQGTHTITVRATDAEGLLQTSEYADVAPDGATGWHSIKVSVA